MLSKSALALREKLTVAMANLRSRQMERLIAPAEDIAFGNALTSPSSIAVHNAVQLAS